MHGKQARSCPGKAAFALGFSHLGRDSNGVIKPGRANEEIAQWIMERIDSFSMVLTQTAITQVWINQGLIHLHDGDILHNTPVYQMHRDDTRIGIRTLPALKAGLGRLTAPPESIALAAQSAHFRRALRDLMALYTGSIDDPGTVTDSYEDSSPLRAVRWALREHMIARPVESLQRLMPDIRVPGEVTLPVISICRADILARGVSACTHRCRICSEYMGLSAVHVCGFCGADLCGNCAVSKYHDSEAEWNRGSASYCPDCPC